MKGRELEWPRWWQRMVLTNRERKKEREKKHFRRTNGNQWGMKAEDGGEEE